jgi:enamine deaminase RidA (YjgF/YER057c/UK114 family)
LLRVWNYLPDINRDCGGTERYRQFNTARQEALLASGRALAGSVPAASALGATSDSPLVVYFLAGRVAPVFVENPRQVSAYHYPRQYGTHSPVFSRAALLRQSESLTLFISGTASIVGHRSLHVGDTSAQTRETLTNIAALLSEANRLARGAHFDLDALAYKVYVRRPADLSVIQAQLASALGARAQIVYLQADICRRDLLVEIEATGICPLAAAA